MLTATDNRTDARITDALRESFTHDAVDGYWYPMDGGTALVRIYTGGNGYMIERRRNGATAWAPIVVAEFAEFDAAAFRAWRTSYPMTS